MLMFICSSPLIEINMNMLQLTNDTMSWSSQQQEQNWGRIAENLGKVAAEEDEINTPEII
jgi:hypothetical protein